MARFPHAGDLILLVPPLTLLGLLGAGWLCGVVRLARGDELALRYRVIVHPGRWYAERLRLELDKR